VGSRAGLDAVEYLKDLTYNDLCSRAILKNKQEKTVFIPHLP